MAPPEKRKGGPRQGRLQIASNNSAEDDSTNDVTLPALAEVVAAALATGVLLVGGRFRLCGRVLRREGRA